jgi:hypothetical protein
LVQRGAHSLRVAGKQKGQKGQKRQKALFVIFAFFASSADRKFWSQR